MIGNLHDYQIEARDFAISHPKCGLFLDLGLGKTLVALSVLEQVYTKETGHILIVAPKSIAKATWAGEIKKWGINIPFSSFIVNEKGKALSKKKRLEAYQAAINNPVRTIYFINRELLADLIENCPVIGKNFLWVFQTIVIDELQSFKSSSSQRFKALKRVMPAVNRFIGLTGTPTPNGIEDIWSQIFLMDNGDRLGKNITAFRRAYMHPGYVNSMGVVCSWVPNDGVEPIIYDKIKDVVISMKNTNLQLPPIAFIDDYVHMSDAEAKLYKRFVDSAVLEFESGDVASAPNIAVMSNKLQQLASGAIYTIDENGNPTGNYEIIHKQKLERLKYIRDNSDDNLLVAYYFNSDADMIMKYCQENDIQCEVFNSSKADEILSRWNDNKIPMLLIQPASAGFGLNFQYASHTLIWYTMSFNLEHYLQTIGRLYRQGQNHTVYVHRLMTYKTIDSKILKAIINKDQNMQALLDAVEYSPDQNQSLASFAEALSLAGFSAGKLTEKDKTDVIYSAVQDASTED